MITTTASPRWRTLAGWVICLTISTIGLIRAGSTLTTPPVTNFGELGQWLITTPAPLVTFAIIRCIGLALCIYLTVVLIANVVAHISGIPLLLRSVNLVTAPSLRRVLRGSLGLGLAATTSFIPPSASMAEETPHGSATSVATMTIIDNAATANPTHDQTSSHVAVMEVVAVKEVVTDMSGSASIAIVDTPIGTPGHRLEDLSPTTQDSAPNNQSQPANDNQGASWTIAPGEHLWHVSTVTLTQAWGRQPSNSEILDYLYVLIEVNRDVLAVPSNPDLVFAGQVFRTPPPPRALR